MTHWKSCTFGHLVQNAHIVDISDKSWNQELTVDALRALFRQRNDNDIVQEKHCLFCEYVYKDNGDASISIEKERKKLQIDMRSHVADCTGFTNNKNFVLFGIYFWQEFWSILQTSDDEKQHPAQLPKVLLGTKEDDSEDYKQAAENDQHFMAALHFSMIARGNSTPEQRTPKPLTITNAFGETVTTPGISPHPNTYLFYDPKKIKAAGYFSLALSPTRNPHFKKVIKASTK